MGNKIWEIGKRYAVYPLKNTAHSLVGTLKAETDKEILLTECHAYCFNSPGIIKFYEPSMGIMKHAISHFHIKDES